MKVIGIVLIIAGYAFIYFGYANLRSGGTGPTLSSVFGFTGPIIRPGEPLAIGGRLGQGSSNQTGQPATTNAPPTQAVRNI